jgi:LysR family transcriptional regulator, glycine cleavage system transcriptional activator
VKHGPFDDVFVNPTFQRRLPPMYALEVFVTAAHSGTFSRAAGELFVTQGAVSRQIRLLEDNLGVRLFVRHKRGLTLTPEAEALLPVVEEAFAQIGKACGSMRNAGQVLTLRMPPTLAMRWFLPLLPTLRSILPGLDVRITTYDAWEPRFEEGDIDAAILHGRGDWPNARAVRLMPELLTPVCSQDLAGRAKTPADLKNLPLLHCYPLNGWALWLNAAHANGVNANRGQFFDTLDLALSAATRSQGVALGDYNLVEEGLRDGVLVQPFPKVLDRGLAYYLVYPEARETLPKIKVLREWLLEAAASQEKSRNDLHLETISPEDE